ncbi:hypothetical protein O6H91_17G053300 [Diphasiastrum complanatum]|nr:hypothetical protein O6H91_17G053300 [Diphasiastrum complanatum]
MEPNDKATDSNSNTGAEFVSSNAGNSAAQERINSNEVEEAKELDRNGNGVELQLANETKTIAEQIAEENSCEGKRMYMYELPSEFNSKILEKCSRGMVEWLDFCPHIANQGFGQALPAADWYATDAYMLEIIYHTRMKNYNCLTSDPTAADAFFLPYYSGLDALRFIYGADKARKHEHGTELIQWLDQNAPETWKRWGGSDHFVVMGRTAWDFANSVDNTQGWGTSFLELPAMTNVTALVLERRSWRDREQAVPYPTGFHPSSPSRLREWISTVESSPRSFLFSFIGALRPRIAANIRGALFTQCQQHPSCLLLDCAQLGCSHNPQPISEALLNSTFCLQPVGDSFTRRSTFDSIAAGCIPVFFHNESAYTQYMWHLPKDASLYSVFIPEDAIRGGAMVADVLGSYSAEKIKEMQGHVKDLIDGVLYTDAAAGGVRDAFEVSVEGMLAMAAQGRAHRQQATVYQSQNWKD